VALSRQPIAIPLVAGVNTKTDAKAVTPPSLIDLQNGVFSKAASIIKRNGYAALSQAVTAAGMDYSDARCLATRDDELLLLTVGAAYSYQDSVSSWAKIADAVSATASDRSVAHTGSNQTVPDAATSAGVRVVAWEDSRGGVWWTLVETAGERILRAPAQLDQLGTRPRCVAVGTVLHILYAQVAANRIYVAVINPATPLATVTPVVLTDDLSGANPSFDAVPTERTNTPALIAWSRNGGGYRLGYVDASGVLGSPLTGHPSVFTNAAVTVGLGPVVTMVGTTACALLYTDGANTTTIDTCFATDPISVASSANIIETANVVRLALAHSTATGYSVWRELTAATARDHLVRVRSLGGADITQRGVGIASRAFVDDDTPCCNLVHEVTYFSIYLTARQYASALFCAARTLPGVCYGLPARAHLPSVEKDADDERTYRWCASWQQQVKSGEDGTGTAALFAEVGIRLVTLDMDPDTGWQSAQLGRSLYFGGACPLRYDGDTLTEAGWHYAPDDVAAPTQAAGGSLSLLGVYEYVFLYEEINAQGEIDRGPVSVGVSVTLTGANNKLTFAVPTYRLTSRRKVRIGVFRSVNGDSSQLFRVTSIDPSATGDNGFVANDTTADTVTFVDAMSDATLITKEPLYTNGDIPSNDPSATGSLMVSGKNRLFTNDASDPLLVRYTQELADASAAEFVDELSVKVDPYGGDITALATLDDRVIIFKRSAIFVIAGAGPLRNPLADPSQGFAAPQLVTSDVGCTAPRSIATTPNGVVFQSAKGIYQLGRDMSVSYLGAQVEAYNAQTVTRATLIEDRTQIVFLCSSGRTLLYDYQRGQWGTHTNHTGLDAAVSGGTYHYLRTDGRVFVETPGEYADDNSQIKLIIETAWVKLTGYLQGFQRVDDITIIGEYKSSHRIRFRYQTDYMASWSAPRDIDWRTFDSGSLYGDGPYGDGAYGGDPPEIYQFKVHLSEACQSIRFRFEDLEDAGSFGASYEISELLLMAGLKRGAIRPIPDTRSG
jgi:hypothetical protein